MFVLVFLLDCHSRGREVALRFEVGMTNSLRMALNCREDGRYYQEIKAKNAYQFANVYGSH